MTTFSTRHNPSVHGSTLEWGVFHYISFLSVSFFFFLLLRMKELHSITPRYNHAHSLANNGLKWWHNAKFLHQHQQVATRIFQPPTKYPLFPTQSVCYLTQVLQFSFFRKGLRQLTSALCRGHFFAVDFLRPLPIMMNNYCPWSSL